MDPLILIAIGVLVLFIVLKMIFGMAKLLFRVGIIVVVLVVIWRIVAQQ